MYVYMMYMYIIRCIYIHTHIHNTYIHTQRCVVLVVAPCFGWY